MFLQDQVNDVTEQRDLPVREAPLKELLPAQDGLVLEEISQHLDRQKRQETAAQIIAE